MIETKQSFAIEFNSLFAKLIRQRNYLIRSGRSQKNEALINQSIDKLMPYKAFVFSDIGAAKFIIRFKYEIRLIISEREGNTINQFDSILSKANQIINSKTLIL